MFTAEKETIIISEPVGEKEKYQKIFWQQDWRKYFRHEMW